jgi:hypothetical protein
MVSLLSITPDLLEHFQVEKIMKNLRSYSDPLQKYIAIMGLQVEKILHFVNFH